jgi:hypothetical protein
MRPSFHSTTIYFPTPTSLHFALLRFTSLHFALFITFLTLFLKLLGLQEKAPKTSSGSWFQSWVVLFTKEYFPISVFCFLLLIFLLWSTLLRYHGFSNLSPTAFQALVFRIKKDSSIMPCEWSSVSHAVRNKIQCFLVSGLSPCIIWKR